jgi:hypothetical protein
MFRGNMVTLAITIIAIIVIITINCVVQSPLQTCGLFAGQKVTCVLWNQRFVSEPPLKPVLSGLTWPTPIRYIWYILILSSY